MAYLWELSSLLVVFLSAVVAQDQPQITKTILPEVKQAGETGYLFCTVTNQGTNKVLWIHKKTSKIISSDDNIEIEDLFNPELDGFPKYDVIKTTVNQLNTYKLIVRRLQPQDQGLYTCQVKQRGTSVVSSKEGEMFVMVPPTISRRETTQVITVNEGANVELECAADGYPTPIVKWVRPNGKALPFRNNTYSFVGRVLNLNDLHRDDRGIYRCVADNNVRPSAAFDSTLYINFKPSALAVQDTYGQAQNRLFDIILECRISGNPQPDLKWYKVTGKDQKTGEDAVNDIGDDDKHVIHTLISYGQELSISEFWYQLTIINIQGNDYGEYICQGSNNLGTTRAKIYLYETSECQGPNCPAEFTFVGAAASIYTSPLLLICMLLWRWVLH